MTAMEALLVANDHRARRFEFKKELLALPASQARALLAEAISDQPGWLAGHSNTAEMLAWCPGVGDATARHYCALTGIRDRRALRRLTDRQRRVLSGLLRGLPTAPTSMIGGTDG